GHVAVQRRRRRALCPGWPGRGAGRQRPVAGSPPARGAAGLVQHLSLGPATPVEEHLSESADNTDDVQPYRAAPVACCAASREAGTADEPLVSTIVPSEQSPTAGLVLLPGGEFLMGTDEPQGYP